MGNAQRCPRTTRSVIGENSVRIRAQVLRGLKWLGIALDEERNVAGEERLSHPHSAALALRLATDEETMIARHTVRAARLASVEVGADRAPAGRA